MKVGVANSKPGFFVRMDAAGSGGMWTRNSLQRVEQSLQKHHSTASTTPDLAQAFANDLIIDTRCIPPICLSDHAVGTPVSCKI